MARMRSGKHQARVAKRLTTRGGKRSHVSGRAVISKDVAEKLTERQQSLPAKNRGGA